MLTNLNKRLRGIFYGWWIVGACFLLHFLTGGTVVYGLAAFFNPIIKEMGWTRAQISFAFAMRSIEGGLVQPFVGFFVDRIGTRKCIFAGMIIMSLAFLLMSRISSLSIFYASTFLLAFGGTLSSGIPQQSAVANWFRRRRSLCIGLLTAGTGLSGIMAPVMVLLINSYGWRQTLVFISPLILIIGIPLSFLIRHRPEPYGYLPDGDKAEEQVAGDTRTGTSGHARAFSEEGLTVKECLKTRTFWLLMGAQLFVGFASQAIQVHAIPYLTGMGITENIAALTITGITITSLIGRLGFSFLGDIYDKKRLLMIAFAMETIGIFIFASIRSPLMIIPFIIFYAPGFGAPIPLIPSIQADCFGTKNFASIRGLGAFSYTIPGIAGPFLAGWLYDLLGNYDLAFIILAVLCTFSIPIIMFAKLTPLKSMTATPEKSISR
ncbi:MAG: MFS transporter [Chloroflexota bacterium]